MPQGEIAPEPWASAMEKVGATSPRTGKPSMNALAELSGVHATTIQRVIYKRLGHRGADPETIQKLADALKVKPARVAKWIGQTWGAGEPYVPPKEADTLGPRARRAVDEMIRTLAELQKQLPKDKDEDDESKIFRAVTSR